jgi:hypothetical protein
MTTASQEWFMLTPQGALQAFGQAVPTEFDKSLQGLLSADAALDQPAWLALDAAAPAVLAQALERGWVQALQQPMRGPDAKLDDFLHHVVASLSDARTAALASEGGFCLGRAGLEQDEADLLCAAAADYFDFAKRQTRRGWDISHHYVTLHSESHLLLPSHTFVPLWVDGTGYWLVILGEPLLNNPALVELLWGIQLAGSRFGNTSA